MAATTQMRQKLCRECKGPLRAQRTFVQDGMRIYDWIENHMPGCTIGASRIDQEIRKEKARVAIVERWWHKVSKPYRDKHRAPPDTLKTKYLCDLEQARRIPTIWA